MNVRNILKMRNYTIVFLLVCYIVASFVLVNYFDRIIFFETNKEKKNIVEAVLKPRTDIPTNLILNVDPFLTSSDDPKIREIRKKLSALVFSSLFIESPNGDVIGDLVDSFTFNNAQNLEITLKSNVKWHDGTDLNAKDVKFSFDVLRSLGNKSLYSAATNGGNLRIDIIDDYKLIINLMNDKSDPVKNSSYLHTLTFPILPAHLLAENFYSNTYVNIVETSFGSAPIGTGPLRYLKKNTNEVELESFEQYFRGDVSLNKYIIRLYESVEDIMYDYKLKNVDLFIRGDTGKIDSISQSLIDVGFNLRYATILSRRYVLYFNIGNKTDDVNSFIKSTLLRRGLLSLINRDKLIERLGVGRQILGPVDQSSSYFYQDILSKFEYNTEAFIRLVESLGYRKENDGFYYKDGKPLFLELTYLEGGDRDVIVDYLIDELSVVGVRVEAVRLSSKKDIDKKGSAKNDFLDTINNRKYQVLLTVVTNYTDYDPFIEWHSTNIPAPGLNLSNYSSKVLDKNLIDIRVSANAEEKKQAFLNFQKIFFEESPAIYLINPGIQIFSSNKLFVPQDLTVVDDHYIYFDILNWVQQLSQNETKRIEPVLLDW
ncbi:MAG: peptide-binding protein [Candidatus Dojkabacteria bacterium]|nr:MAG: peptide-binding protein [Candidatus Dojkabacteria bacterium]